MKRYYYSDTIADFLDKGERDILGALAQDNEFSLEPSQRDAWVEEIRILKSVLPPYRNRGTVYFEYSIPRLGKRIDVVVLIGPVLFVLEFKVGEKEFPAHAVDQVWDYALDLKNFHESSHHCHVAPVLIATAANAPPIVRRSRPAWRQPSAADPKQRRHAPRRVCPRCWNSWTAPAIVADEWEQGRYCPTPTIIEAATALYNGHSVADISRSDASAINLSRHLRRHLRSHPHRERQFP